jgi:hypothetical protein
LSTSRVGRGSCAAERKRRRRQRSQNAAHSPRQQPPALLPCSGTGGGSACLQVLKAQPLAGVLVGDPAALNLRAAGVRCKGGKEVAGAAERWQGCTCPTQPQVLSASMELPAHPHKRGASTDRASHCCWQELERKASQGRGNARAAHLAGIDEVLAMPVAVHGPSNLHAAWAGGAQRSAGRAHGSQRRWTALGPPHKLRSRRRQPYAPLGSTRAPSRPNLPPTLPALPPRKRSSTCCSMVSTRGGSSPRRPSRSRSTRGCAVPCTWGAGRLAPSPPPQPSAWADRGGGLPGRLAPCSCVQAGWGLSAASFCDVCCAPC